MSESRSRLVRAVAEREYERRQAALGRLIPWADLSERERQPFYDRAEVVVAAVLDELSEGPLHDAMVKVIYAVSVRVWGFDAALSVARTWNEEE